MEMVAHPSWDEVCFFQNIGGFQQLNVGLASGLEKAHQSVSSFPDAIRAGGPPASCNLAPPVGTKFDSFHPGPF